MRAEARHSGAPARLGALVLAMVAAAVLPCAAAQALAAPSLAYRLEGDALAMIDPAALAVIDRIPLLPGARELAVGSDGRRAYALGWNYLQIVDLAARSVRAAVPAGGENARALHLAPDGQRLYLYERESYGDELALDVLDATAAVERSMRLPLPPGTWTAYVTGFAADAGGGRAWMVLAADGESGRELWIDEIDLATGAVRGQVRSVDAGDAGFGQAAIAPARAVAFVSASRPSGSEVLEVELGTGAVLARVPLPAGALPVWDAARERLYAWTYARRAEGEREHTALFALDPGRGRAHRLAAFAGWPAAAALAPGGAFWINLGEPVPRTVVVDAERGDVLGEIAATGGVGALAFAPALPDAPPPTTGPSPTPAPPQSHRALVLSADAHTVTEIDTGSAAAVRVRIEHALRGVAIIGASADGARVDGVADDALLRFDSESGEVRTRRIGDEVSCCLQRGALAPDGRHAWVSNGQSLWAVDASSGAPLGNVELGGYEVQAIAFAPDGSRLLVVTDHDWNDIDQGALHIIDPVARRELWALDFPGEGRDLAVSSDGRRAWIAAGEAVVVVDLAAAAIAAIVPAPADAVALGPDGERAYVAGGRTWTGAPLSLTAIDGRSLRAAGAIAVADAGSAGDLALTPDGQRALLAIDGAPARVAVVDLSRLETVGFVPVGARPRAVVIAAEPWTPPPTPTPRPHRPAGSLRPCMLAPLAAGEQPPAGGIALLDPARHGVAATIQVGEPSAESQDLTLFDGVSAVAADPDGTLLYATVPSHRGGAGYLAAVDPATNAVVDRLPLGIDSWSLSLTADGRQALVANYNGYLGHPSLSIVDLRAWRLVDEVPLPDGARGIYPSVDGRLLFVRAQQRRYVDGHDVYDDRLFAVDPLSGAVNFEIPLSTDRTPSGGIAVLPDERALLADIDADAGYSEPEIVAVLDIESRAPVARIEIPFTSWGYRAYGSATFAVSPDGGEVYRGTGASPGTVAVIDPVARQLLAQIPVEHGFGPPAFTPDGAFVYGGGFGGVAVIDTAARRLAAAIPLAASAGNIVAALIDAPCAALRQPPATPTATSDPAPTGPTATPPPSPTPTWSGSWVDLRIGSASGRRGTTVAVDVRLDSAVAVAGTQIGIAYGPPLAIAATAGGQPACRAHPEAGKPSAFAFWPVGCGGDECRVVRALTLALDDVEPIAAGARLFTCDVVIAADAAPGAYPLRAVEVGASDAQGNALPARGHAGEVRVPTPAGGRLAARAGADAGGCAIAPPAADRGAWLCAGLVLLLALRRKR